MTPSKKWILYEPVKTHYSRIFPELAVEIGLNESIVLMQISYWITISDNEREGKYWTYQSLRDMKDKAFPFWGVETIRRTIESLHKMGYILIDNFNPRKSDKTQWFALEPDKCSSLKSVLCDVAKGEAVSKRDEVSQNETVISQNETTLPETTTENRTENKDSIAPEVAKPETPVHPVVVRKEPLANLKAAMGRAMDKYTETGVVPGAAEKKEADHEHQRVNNPMYDTVYSVWKLTAGRNGLMQGLLEGRAKRKGWKEYNLETPVTPDEVKAWACWYRKTELHGDLQMNMVEEPSKVQSSITHWQSIGKPTANGITPEKQALIDSLKNYKPADPNSYIGAEVNHVP